MVNDAIKPLLSDRRLIELDALHIIGVQQSVRSRRIQRIELFHELFSAARMALSGHFD
jgi:hypothetical protein